MDYANRYGHEKVARLLKSAGAKGEIDSRYFGYSPYLRKPLNEGEAFAWNMGRVGYAVKTLQPKAYLAMAASESTEFVLSEVAKTLEKYKDSTEIFCPEHRGDMFILKK